MAKRRLLPSFLPSGPSRKKKNGSVPSPPFSYLVAVGVGGVGGGQETVTGEASSIAITPSSSFLRWEGRGQIDTLLRLLSRSQLRREAEWP